jgi:hypothetical protein
MSNIQLASEVGPCVQPSSVSPVVTPRAGGHTWRQNTHIAHRYTPRCHRTPMPSGLLGPNDLRQPTGTAGSVSSEMDKYSSSSWVMCSSSRA